MFQKNKESKEKQIKERMDMFMVEIGRNQDWDGFELTTKKKVNLKKQTMTSLPYYLTNTY